VVAVVVVGGGVGIVVGATVVLGTVGEVVVVSAASPEQALATMATAVSRMQSHFSGRRFIATNPLLAPASRLRAGGELEWCESGGGVSLIS
jgi:hypothetical protein